MEKTYKKLSHLPNLDILRAIAILMVINYHIFHSIPELPHLIVSLSKPGQYGVDLFFVLSGFLISCLFFNEMTLKGSVDIPRFISRRISRTLPPYYIMLLASYLAVYFHRNQNFDISYLFFLQNYTDKIPFFLISWSLCVEEHFYLILPFALTIIFKFHKKLATIVVVLFILLPFLLRAIEGDAERPFGYYRTASHLHFGSLILGVLAGWFYTYKTIALNNTLKIVAVAMPPMVLLASCIIDKQTMFKFGKFPLAASFTFLLLYLATTKQFNLGKSRVVQIIANSSYAAYLTHALVIHLCMKVLSGLPSPVIFLITFGATIIVGALFYLFIEKPLMGLRRKLIPSGRE